MAQYGAAASSSSTESDQVTTCVICLESLENSLAALRCGHVFHHSCAMEAIAHRHACPVCRLQVSPQNVVRLYLSLAEQVARHDNSECNVTHRIEPTNASRLPERLREMKGELDRAHRIQRMTSKHSFRLENAVVRLKQKLEQTTRRMQHIQRELKGAKAQLQIATTIYTQYNQSRRALIELDCKVRNTAELMLETIRERQYSRCASCVSEWAEMNRIARELAPVGSGACCRRHTRQRSTRTTRRAPPRSYLHQPQSAADQRDCVF